MFGVTAPAVFRKVRQSRRHRDTRHQLRECSEGLATTRPNTHQGPADNANDQHHDVETVGLYAEWNAVRVHQLVVPCTTPADNPNHRKHTGVVDLAQSQSANHLATSARTAQAHVQELSPRPLPRHRREAECRFRDRREQRCRQDGLNRVVCNCAGSHQQEPDVRENNLQWAITMTD